MSNVDRAEEVLDKVTNKFPDSTIYYYMDGYEFSEFMQRLLVSEDGYVVDTGNWEVVNYAIAWRLLEKIKKHPWIWKFFFEVA